MKYSIPRNRQIPDPTPADILGSGSIVKDATGGPAGDRLFFYHGTDPKLPHHSLIPVGKFYPFKFGFIYVPEDDHILAEFVAETVRTGATLALWGATAALPLPLSAAAFVAIDRAVYPERATPPKSVQELTANWAKRGALFLPAVQIVEIEDYVDPGGLITKKTHRLMLAYETVDGQRTSYTVLLGEGPKTQHYLDGFISILLKARWVAEFDHLITAVKSEHVNATPVWDAHIAQYQARYGAEWGKHAQGLIAEVTAVLEGDLQRQGFTPQRGMAEILKRIAPLVPHYRQAPELKDWVRALEEASAGPPATASV